MDEGKIGPFSATSTNSVCSGGGVVLPEREIVALLPEAWECRVGRHKIREYRRTSRWRWCLSFKNR